MTNTAAIDRSCIADFIRRAASIAETDEIVVPISPEGVFGPDSGEDLRWTPENGLDELRCQLFRMFENDSILSGRAEEMATSYSDRWIEFASKRKCISLYLNFGLPETPEGREREHKPYVKIAIGPSGIEHRTD